MYVNPMSHMAHDTIYDKFAKRTNRWCLTPCFHAPIRPQNSFLMHAREDGSPIPVVLHIENSRSFWTRYLGVDPEPRPNLPSGHIPGSFSLPFNQFLESHKPPSRSVLTPIPSHLSDGYTKLRSPEALSQELHKSVGPSLAEQILRGQRKIVMTCGSGMTAAILWLGLSTIWEAQKKEGITLGLFDEVRLLL